MKSLPPLLTIVFCIAGTAHAGDVQSTSKVVPFEECLKMIRNKATELKVAPENLVETDIVRMVRFPATDGSVLFTCSKLDNKLVITTNK